MLSSLEQHGAQFMADEQIRGEEMAVWLSVCFFVFFHSVVSL